ncbi:MAG: MSMEG_0570 family nitrogen starvation response protein [Betaproteobacteria bacterium]|nr:MSMEG_0570 family nitrogen starvation response protein [Betaproteobacteria bacterium]
MPEVRFRVRWPDRSLSECYSPSSVVKDFFAAGASYDLADFLQRARRALDAASERVRLKYGWACSRAHDQLAEIEATAERYARLKDPRVTLEAFEEEPR